MTSQQYRTVELALARAQKACFFAGQGGPENENIVNSLELALDLAQDRMNDIRRAGLLTDGR